MDRYNEIDKYYNIIETVKTYNGNIFKERQKLSIQPTIPPRMKDENGDVIIEDVSDWFEYENGSLIKTRFCIVKYPLDVYNKKFKSDSIKMKECEICGRLFYPRRIGGRLPTDDGFSKTCSCCDLVVECSNPECKKLEIVADHVTRVLFNIKSGKSSACSLECAASVKKLRYKSKICPECGDSNFNIMGLCMTCHNIKINKSITCKKHGYQETSFAGKCFKCLAEENIDSMRERAYKNLDKINNFSLKWCDVCNKETKHNGVGVCINCSVRQIFEFNCEDVECNEMCVLLEKCKENPKLYKEKNGKEVNKNHNGFCKDGVYFAFNKNKGGFVLFPCEKEDYKPTPHSVVDGDIVCLSCNGSMREYDGEWYSKEKYDDVVSSKEKLKTLAKFGYKQKPEFITRDFYINNSAGNLEKLLEEKLVWCDHCKAWETKEFNEQIYHWVHWSILYRKLTHDGVEEPRKLAEFLNIEERFSGYECCIYAIESDGVCYVGQTKEPVNRFLAHLCNVYMYPQYWTKNKSENIVQDILDGRYEFNFKILEKCDTSMLNERELYWIEKLQPWSQKCNGTDNIKSLEERKEEDNE